MHTIRQSASSVVFLPAFPATAPETPSQGTPLGMAPTFIRNGEPVISRCPLFATSYMLFLSPRSGDTRRSVPALSVLRSTSQPGAPGLGGSPGRHGAFRGRGTEGPPLLSLKRPPASVRATTEPLASRTPLGFVAALGPCEARGPVGATGSPQPASGNGGLRRPRWGRRLCR